MRQASFFRPLGLVALSLTLTTAPAQASSWSASIQDVMNLVYCLVGLGECVGVEPGADVVDITSDNGGVCVAAGGAWDAAATMCAPAPSVTCNDAAIAAATCAAAMGSWDGVGCTPNALLLGGGGEIAVDTVWSGTVTVEGSGVFVTDSATLTIAPGTVVYFGGGLGLTVEPGATLIADGTVDAPIVFTAIGDHSAPHPAPWAGLILMGQASVNNWAIGKMNSLAPIWDDVPSPGSWLTGTEDDSSCGSLQYVRLEHAGANLSASFNTNGLTVAGCGSGTTLDHIQVFDSVDDSVAIWGGTAHISHLLATEFGDDGLDGEGGWRGKAEFLIIDSTGADRAIECDNSQSDGAAGEDLQPRTSPTLDYVTLIGGPGSQSIMMRYGAHADMDHMIVYGFSESPDFAGETTDFDALWPGLLSIENSLFFSQGVTWGNCESWEDEGSAGTNDDLGFDECAAITDEARLNGFDVDPGLAVHGGSCPDYAPSQPAAVGIGAIPDGVDWTLGWTRDGCTCGTHEYVAGHTCTPCPAGASNDAGDDATGGDTLCEGMVVSDGACAADTCQNGGICTDLGEAVDASHACTCPTSYDGPACGEMNACLDDDDIAAYVGQLLGQTIAGCEAAVALLTSLVGGYPCDIPIDLSPEETSGEWHGTLAAVCPVTCGVNGPPLCAPASP